MNYLMRCDSCDAEIRITCSISEHEHIVKPGIECRCRGIHKQVLEVPEHMFTREPFPGTGNEMQLPTPHGVDVKFRDKIEGREWLGERGLMSKWIENDM